MARSRVISNCCSIWAVWMNIALLVCTHEHLGAVVDLRVQPVVVGHVEADRVGDQGAVHPQRLDAGAAEHVARDQRELAEVAA